MGLIDKRAEQETLYGPVDDCTCDLCARLKAKVTERRLLGEAEPKKLFKLDPYFHELQKSKQKGGENK